ncbi:MAG: cardiolipin synthase [Phormidesmis sp.]
MWSTINLLSIYSVLSIVVHGLGILNAAHAVMNVRSSRGAIAWSLSLISLPWITIPLYWTLGKNEFQGYSEALQKAYSEHRELVHHAYSEILDFKISLRPKFASLEKLANHFTSLPFTDNNSAELLIDGEQTYRHMLSAIAQAKQYILFQTYILHSDDIGNTFKDALIAKAKQGVTIHLLYDGIGARKLPKRYINALEAHDIIVKSFRSTKGIGRRFQINFRNHRKILIIDGQTAFVGGLNIGDEYLGKDPKLGDWRDTHLQVQGTVVKCLQRTFLADWYWAAKEIPEVSWSTQALPTASHNQTAFVLATGPADPLQACALFFLGLINRANTRLWIASPYFVPSSSVLNALKLAALRGVDVRIILPNRPDQWLVYLCSFSYYEELHQVGIQVYRYQPGFMHQKVILCDRDIAGVGTTNLDNRSFFLNFEVMTFIIDDDQDSDGSEASFIGSVEQMLVEDMNASRQVNLCQYQQKPFWFKLAARVSRLLSPIL